ncbi:MAG: hypothetical protein II638_02680 [Erysipelotrichaceae bacterium]|nr:hypothetical protein [Erysipelotrichaceae bacterium]
MDRYLALFGAFNPPTVAHVYMAEEAMELTGAKGVIFVPSKSQYISTDQGKDFVYSEYTRRMMLEELAKTRPWMKVYPWELKQQEQPRTYTTLCQMKQDGLDASLLFGSDKLPELEHGWLHVEEIAKEFGIVVMERNEDDAEKIIAESAYLSSLAPYIQVLKLDLGLRDVSSTKVRELVAEMITLMGSITSKEDLVRLRTLQRSFVLLVPKEIQKSLFLEYYYRKQ